MKRFQSILIVDDSPDVLRPLAAWLRSEGFSVFEALNGAEAARMVPELPGPILMLLDLVMPVVDGWELIEKKLSISDLERISIVITSGQPLDEVWKGSRLRNAAIGYLRKPFNVDALYEVVRQNVVRQRPPGSPPLEVSSLQQKS